jgi:PTS system nitrogen regulatory IIA component
MWRQSRAVLAQAFQPFVQGKAGSAQPVRRDLRLLPESSVTETIMAIGTLFSASDVILDLDVRTKRDLFQYLAAAAAERTDLSQEAVLEALNAREKIGSTGLGKGVGLPHAELDQATSPFMLFVRLAQAVDFDSQDDEPVDLVFLVLWPASGNKELLSTISTLCRVLREPQTLRQLRQAETPERSAQILHDVSAVDPKRLASPSE